MPDALSRIAALAPTLGEAELRVLIELTATRQESTCRSSRSLAKATKLSRSNVQHAIDTLAGRGIIKSDTGTATRASKHDLAFLRTEVLSTGEKLTGPGSVAGPPPGSISGPQVALFQGQGGITAGPEVASQQGHFRAREDRIDSDSSFVAVFDRLAKASPKGYDQSQIASTRSWLHGYVAKLGRERNPHPPDDAIVAQFLSVADWPALEKLLYDLMAERKEPGASYAWFVAVALQRIHGIAPQVQRQLRADLKLVSPSGTGWKPAASTTDLQAAIAAAASKKAMR